MSSVLDTQRPYTTLDPNDDWREQDGILFNWSESNIDYEAAWWWYVDSETMQKSSLVLELRKERPYPETFKGDLPGRPVVSKVPEVDVHALVRSLPADPRTEVPSSMSGWTTDDIRRYKDV